MRFFIFILLFMSLNIAMGEIVNITVRPESSTKAPVRQLTKPDNTQDFAFPAFSEKVVLELELKKSYYLHKITLTANAIPTANFATALVEVRDGDGNTWTPVEALQSPSEQTKILYQVQSKPLSAKARYVRITLTPAFIESSISLRGIGLELSDKPAAAAALKSGGIVIGGKNTPGYLTRSLVPGMKDGEKLLLTAGFLLPGENDFECNLLVQKENTATALRIVLRSKDGKREVGYHDKTGYKTLFPMGNENQQQIGLECDNNSRKFTLAYGSEKSEELPFNTALPAIDTIMFSVPVGSDGVQLNILSYTLTGKSGTRTEMAADFSDAAEFDRFKRSGRILRVEPQAEALRPAASELITVEAHGRQYSFSRRNGELFGIADSSGKLLIDSLRTLYSLQVKEQDRNFDGLFDKAIEVKRQGENSIEFHCTAAFDPEVKIIKKYTAEANEFTKELTFLSKKNDGIYRFVTPAERLIFPAARRQNLVLTGGDPWYSPRVKLNTIKLPARQSGSGVSHAVAAFEPAGPESSVALLRYRVNNRFVWPVHSAYIYEPGNVLIYHPDGVQLPVTTLPLHTPEGVSCESKILFYNGSEMDFLAAYRQLDEVKKAYAEIQRPEWMANVLTQIWVRPELSGDAVKQLKQLLALTDRGDIMVILNQPFIWGDLGEDKRFLNIWGAWTEDHEYMELIKALKALSPRVKVALYTWLWTIAPESKFYRDNPDSAISRNRNDQIFNSYPGVELSFQRKMNNQQTRDKLAEQYKTMVSKYGVDYVYLDGGHGGAPLIDWQSGTVDQDYQWQDFYRYMRRLSAEYGQGGVSFNFKSNPIADSGIAEMALDAFRNNAALVGARIWGGKLQEKFDPGHRVIPCYWGKSDPYYSNICIGLGLLPHIECAGLSVVEPNFLTVKAPYLTTMREMFQTVPVRIIPGSMLDSPASTILGFELERGGSTIYSLIPSKEKDSRFELEIADRFLWQNNLVNPTGFRDIFTEQQQIDTWRRHRWKLSHTIRHTYLGKKTGQINIPLQSPLLSIISAGNSRAVILAADGLPTQLRLPTLPGISVETTDAPNEISGSIKQGAGAGIIEVAVALPSGKRLSGTAGGNFKGLFRAQNTAFAVIETNGDFKLKLASASSQNKPEPITLPTVQPGGSLKISLPDGTDEYTAVSIYRDGQLIMTRKLTDEVEIPELARQGQYELKIENAAGILAEAILNITDSKPVPLPEIPKIIRPKAVLNKVNHPDIQGVALGGGQDEKADIGSLILIAKIKERPETLWNYSSAGFEFKKTRYLKIKASSDIATRYCIERRKSWASAFAGILVDYAVGGKYIKRVAMDLGMVEYAWQLPEYGTGRKPDRQVKLGNWIQQRPEANIAVDLQQYAPEDWSGECIVSALVANVLQGRKLELKIEKYSDADSNIMGETITNDNENNEKLTKVPAPVILPEDGTPALIDDFRELVTLKKAIPSTRLEIRQDSDKLYFDFICYEPDINSIIPQSGEWVHAADSVELYFYHPANKKLDRIAVNAGGMIDAGELSGITAKSNIDKNGKLWKTQITVPRSVLPGGDTLMLNACRNRPRRYHEPAGQWTSSAWARLPKELYAMPEFFGTVHLRRPPPAAVTNAGIGGNNTANLLARLERDVLSQKPDTVILMAGTNDMLNSGNAIPLKEAITNLEKLTDRIQAANANVILMTIPPCYDPYVLKRHPASFFGDQAPSEKVKLYNQAVRELAKRKNLILADVARNFEKNGNIGESAASYLRNPVNGQVEDGVHPVATGYRAIAQLLFDTLAANHISPVRLVCFGDSITFGAGGDKPGRMDGENYPAYLSKLLNK